eukprot:TRINITY_DN1145_c0_g1_i3.p1 TRINITY_DN1145_c0_g1~~TRINITY_DN1145_c0_g1_i3.p1  ORF type:complete len:495 (-),score=121.47 TRINITY_DN1145_c0_g1_i3:184-1668(-)
MDDYDSYSITPEVLPSQVIRLEVGVAHEDVVPKEQFKYFQIEHTDTTKLLTIHAIPNNKESDPDLYVNNSSRVPNKSEYTWKSCLVGRDRVDVHPQDPANCPGIYSIGILGYTEITSFTVHAVYTEPAPIRVMQLGQTVEDTLQAGETHYFKFYVDPSSRSTIFIKARTLTDQQLRVFSSNSVMYPSENLCRWRGETESDSEACLEFEADEFKYSDRLCYVGVSPIADGTPYSLQILAVHEEDGLSENLRIGYRKFERVFESSDGGRISQSERRNQNLQNCKSFTYGEIEFVSFGAILATALAAPGEVFYDLGCGAGKALIAAELINPFSKCIGVEFLAGLAELAQSNIQRYLSDASLWPSWRNAAAPAPADSEQAGSVLAPHLEVVHTDMLQHPWWLDADVIYTSSICFEDELYNQLTERFTRMKPGARICTLKTLPPEHFDLLDRGWFRMSWGKCIVYIFRRRDPNSVSATSPPSSPTSSESASLSSEFYYP